LFKKLSATYQEFPPTFWTLIGAAFIDRLGGALIFPFLALYVTQKFQVGMTQVGIVFLIFSIASLVGNLFGGAMTDRFGRKKMLLFGLITSGLSSLTLGFISDFRLVYPTALVVGLLSNTAGPAQQAMVADLLPVRQRTEGFGILRVIANLAITIGPAIGGVLATNSYLLLFISDALSSLVTAGIVLTLLPETMPEISAEQTDQSLGASMGGYRNALQDWVFIAFLAVSTLMVLVYVQMNSTLSVYLRDVHGISPKGFGYILSLNAAIVVLFQFWVTRRITKYRAMGLMAVGSLFYALGFGMYGFVHSYSLFLAAMVIITIGEMLVTPTAQSLVASLAPEDMRGRYMALYGMSWILPNALGPLAAGIIMDNYNPDWVWYAGGFISIAVAIGYLTLNAGVEQRLTFSKAVPENGRRAETEISTADSIS
jgi:MFS family permease